MGAPSATTDFDASAGKVTSPAGLAHIVLRTANFASMVDFYTKFLGGTITYGNDFLSFITYDEEHHRIAIISVPGTAPKQPTSSGLEHVSFSFTTMHNLLLAYRQRKQKGIEPVWSVNHGPTTSIYYKDPDRNMIETQVDNFASVEEATAFMNSEHFVENPIGTDVDPEDLIARLQNGESDKSLMKRVEIGARAVPDLVAM
ncbi:hypothetical protein LTR78_001775 [Recurvomyces mirabilis]|uniref:VOC domain-containing protein n=1 Tax=Recurvomyces mirabilis TaxID=574656 RepID=A0AAE0WV95_9PEZI|nr:hypothetical protein LTR78_001775 [Recurvomyces mirabilis]KAK5156786.1 hypothetical protein LTS14_004999 [Recurvomyces mirabilis]